MRKRGQGYSYLVECSVHRYSVSSRVYSNLNRVVFVSSCVVLAGFHFVLNDILRNTILSV